MYPECGRYPARANSEHKENMLTIERRCIWFYLSMYCPSGFMPIADFPAFAAHTW